MTSAITSDELRTDDHELVNASGHAQELERNFSLLSVASVGITTGNTWAALGGSIAIAIYNGGPPGVLYELIASSVFYWMVAACIAELASAIPSSAGVYHWATVTAGPRFGKPVGFFAGWWNFFAWIFGAASMSSIVANQTISMWSLFHPDYAFQRWHVFVVYLITTWMCCAVVLFANRALPYVGQMGLFFILAGVLVSILVCAIMPSTTGTGHASDHFVWKDWQNMSGWPDGFAFLTGMLNAAYGVGTPDCVSHLAEEIPNPRTNIPKAIAAQMVVGLITAICYLVTLFYSINDLDAVLNTSNNFPLAEIYHQATSSRGGALGLLLVIYMPTLVTCIGCYITAGRMLWTLARDSATPASGWLRTISPTWKNPFNATLVCGIICSIMACIYVGSDTAFNAFVGSFVILVTLSYLSAILPHMLTRKRNVAPGPFQLKGVFGYTLGIISCAYMAVFIVIFCFPFAMPVDALTMNYASLITGGLTIFIAAWWFWKSTRGYEGPKGLIEVEAALVAERRADSVSIEKV
ncbi:amino acid transporter [Eremomyces bilateralis CBS 781.70]|uniref:Amino acid transporter n=1 Tax=Eremomyces bilateralis CBS 781.70 TaxID=1392243 RepID=A0A6G1FXZ5_9PEZI|nr:amino acid transporter [Eremomyces bilateralis CBS 781.70]KAF1810707.1 amino acid transporter [Eremomyces bilateralis CBS 781.70]